MGKYPLREYTNIVNRKNVIPLHGSVEILLTQLPNMGSVNLRLRMEKRKEEGPSRTSYTYVADASTQEKGGG